MFSRITITKSTGNFSEQIPLLKQVLAEADAVLVGAGAGMSTSAGLTYDGERFERFFADFHRKYGITDMYSGGFYPYATPEEYWAWWSRQILVNRYDAPTGRPYTDLRKLLAGKDYFVLTTNVDHQFQLAGFDKDRLFYTQGDYGLFQCSRACHDRTYDNETAVRQMVAEQKDMKISHRLIPLCPVCGAPMTMNLHCDDLFVQDSGWYAAAERYKNFLARHKGKRLLFLELGVGMNTPGIIKYPFWKMALENPNVTYVCINAGESFCPTGLAKRSLCLNGDIGEVLQGILRSGGDIGENFSGEKFSPYPFQKT